MTPERLARVAAALPRVTPCTPSRLIFIPFGDCRRPVIPALIVRANSSARPPRFSRTVHGRFITYIIMRTRITPCTCKSKPTRCDGFCSFYRGPRLRKQTGPPCESNSLAYALDGVIFFTYFFLGTSRKPVEKRLSFAYCIRTHPAVHTDAACNLLFIRIRTRTCIGNWRSFSFGIQFGSGRDKNMKLHMQTPHSENPKIYYNNIVNEFALTTRCINYNKCPGFLCKVHRA